MADLNQQEQEVVDLMRARYQVWALQELGKALGWGVGKLTLLLAGLEAKGLVKTWTGKGYPHTKYYALKR